jgi:hypothetical protein
VSRRTVYILAGILAVLVALIAVSRWSMSRPSLPEKPPADLAGATEQTVQRVTISSAEASVDLAKKNGTWTVEAPKVSSMPSTATAAPADSTRIKALFDEITASSFERLVARQATDLAAFGLDDATATRLQLAAQSGTLADLLLGNDADVPGTCYVKAADKPEVWVLSGNVKDALLGTHEEWLASSAATEGAIPATGTDVGEGVAPAPPDAPKEPSPRP